MSIVGNLLDNAVEATLHCPAPHEAIELYISDGSDELVIEVADRGTGIAEEIRDTLFEQGVTTKADKATTASACIWSPATWRRRTAA